MKPYYAEDGITIYHADCREEQAWLVADSLVTDPPYGMGFTSGMGGAFGLSEVVGDESTDARTDALNLWGTDKPALVFGRWSVAKPYGTRAVLTWEKGNHVGMGDLALPWKPNTEEIYVLGRGFINEHRGSSVVKALAIAGTVGQAGRGDRHHPTEKPVGLMAYLIERCPGVIADPFMGSGTTLRAAKDLGRRAIGVEITERYCEIAVKRLAQGVLPL